MKITVMMYFDMHDELEVLVGLKCYERYILRYFFC